jgi:flagellar basal-body rod protein FlgB
MKIFDQTLQLLERSLDTRLERHNVLASNLANADTPGFQPRDIDFNAAMNAAAADIQSQAAERATSGSAEFGSASVKHAPAPTLIGKAASAAAGIDGNKVDADRVLVSLAENGLQYGASAKAAGKKLAILRYVASDGNG